LQYVELGGKSRMQCGKDKINPILYLIMGHHIIQRYIN